MIPDLPDEPLRRQVRAQLAARHLDGVSSVQRGTGRLDEARRLGERSIECSPGHDGFAAHAFHLLGDIATHPDRFDAESGEAHYREALSLAVPRSMRPLAAHCHLGPGRLYRRVSKRQEAQEHLTTAATMYREMGMRFWLEKAEAELKECT
jgi:hypothetical protein